MEPDSMHRDGLVGSAHNLGCSYGRGREDNLVRTLHYDHMSY
jgi:hypothetical protein